MTPTRKPMHTDNEVIVVFGATGGIGSPLVKRFVEKKYHVVITGRDTQKLIALRSGLEPTRIRQVTADATDSEQVERVFQTALDSFGRIDAVVIAVGTHKKVSLKTPTKEAVTILRQHQTEFETIPFIVAKTAAGVLQSQKHGLLVNISSHVTKKRKDLEGNLTYRMTKAAAETLFDDIRNELAGTKVQVTTIAPSTVNTVSNEKYLRTKADKAAAIQPVAIADRIIKNMGAKKVKPWQLMAGGKKAEFK